MRRLTFECGEPLFYIAADADNQNASVAARGRERGRKSMRNLTRRSVLRSSLGVAAAGALARPYIANAAATSIEVWFAQGFVPEEDAAFNKMCADYEKQSGNKVEQQIIPFAALRQKEVSAITSGVVPDLMEIADNWFGPLQAWDDKLVELDDIVEPIKGQFLPASLGCSYYYNNVSKKRAYYLAPMKSAAVPFHIWRSLVEKGGGNLSELPNTWDAFIDFFKPLQPKLREAGLRNVYSYGYQLTTNGVDPINTFCAFMIAYGGQDLVTPDGKLHNDNPQVLEAVIKTITRLTDTFKAGLVPPSCVNWNDADDNNAFHSKLMVMDFDGTISTELALFHDKEQFEDILTHGMPKGNDGKPLPSQVGPGGPMIPKGAKNVAGAKEFASYMMQPKVLNEYLKAGLGRWMLPIPDVVKSDPFWLHDDPHRAAYATQTIIDPTMPLYEVYNPAMAQVGAEHLQMIAVFDVLKNGMTPQAAVDKMFKRTEEIFAKYPIVSS
jgi:multiple sugar transport system substrate-binding protein